jgi:CHAT domain-containing protein/uncharacterized protein HemY
MPHVKARRFSLIMALMLGLSPLMAQVENMKTGARSPNDEASLRLLVTKYFDAVSKKDLGAAVRLWSERSPTLASRKRTLRRLFERTERLEVRFVRLDEVAARGAQASGKVEVEMKIVFSKGETSAVFFEPARRTMEFVKEGEAWKIWRDRTEEDLAAALLEAKDESARVALLNEEQESVNANLVHALAAQGARLSTEDKYPQALAAYELARVIAERINDRAELLKTLMSLGRTYRLTGDFDQALGYFQKALALAEQIKDKIGTAQALNNISIIYGARGDYSTALDYQKRSLALKEEVGDKASIASTLQNLGNIYGGLGDYSRSLEYFQQSLALRRELGGTDRMGISQTLANIGHVESLLGNYGAALESIQQSLALAEQLGNESGKTERLILIGNVYRMQGDYAQALAFFLKALRSSETTGNKPELAESFDNIGEVYYLLGDTEQALDYFRKGLALGETMKDKVKIAYSLRSIGNVYASQGKYAQALAELEKNLQLSNELGDRTAIAQSLHDIGSVHYRQSDFAKALEFSERAAELSRQNGNRETLWASRTLSGKSYRALNQSPQARQAFDEAIATIEALRTQVAGDEQQQLRFFENKLAPYQEMVSLLLSQQNVKEALAYSERAKARTLLDVLGNGRVNIIKAMNAEEETQERSLNEQVISLEAQITQEGARPQPDHKRLAELDSRLRQARLGREAFLNSLYATHPQLKVRRGQAQPFTVDQAHSLLPDTKSALLEFAFTETNSYLFVLTKNGGQNQAPVEVKVYTLSLSPQELTKRAESFRQQLATRGLGFKPPAQELYAQLLAPAQQQLAGKSTLIIVPDGALWNLPFQALLTPQGRYLVEDFAVAYAPSLTVLREVMRAHEAPQTSAHSAPTLLALGSSLAGSQLGAAIKPASGHRSAELTESEKQVIELGRLYGQARSKVYTGADASEERAKGEAGRYRILQFATHGILNDDNPMYSYIELARGGSEDGHLEAWEMMNLDLHADMVVLSACETERGRVGAGEGVIGMMWSLFVAGSPTTVVSQWRVESTSTTELMLDFHRRLLVGGSATRSPAPKARALQQAALSLLHGNVYQHPFYWAGFVVVGDPR